jgi:hypothetical protein
MNKQEHEALRLCVEALDQLLPYLAKVPADVGLLNDALVAARPLLKQEPAPAQTAPQGKFAIGDRVKKTSGSEWVGRVCGTYSTPLTPEGYAVESEAHAGSVQIYPDKALEAAPEE